MSTNPTAIPTSPFLRITDYLGSFATPLAVHIYGARPNPAGGLPHLSFITTLLYCTPAALTWKYGYDLIGILTFMPTRQRAFRWKTVHGYAPPIPYHQRAVADVTIDFPGILADIVSAVLGAKGVKLCLSPDPWRPVDVWQMFACFGLLRIWGLFIPLTVDTETRCYDIPKNYEWKWSKLHIGIAHIFSLSLWIIPCGLNFMSFVRELRDEWPYCEGQRACEKAFFSGMIRICNWVGNLGTIFAMALMWATSKNGVWDPHSWVSYCHAVTIFLALAVSGVVGAWGALTAAYV